MTDYQKVRPGQPLKITAKSWNRVLETVSTRPTFVGQNPGFGRPCHMVQIKNTTSSTVPKWGVLAITGIANDPTAGASSLSQFQDVPILEGATPSDTTAGKFVVTVEPIAAGKFGRAAIDGVVQAKVEVDKVDDKFVACSSGGLKTGVKGDGLILWKQSGTGSNKWALVRLASGGADAGIVRGTFTAPWTKGSTKTVTDAVTSGTTYADVKNYFASVSGTGSKACSIAYVGTEWILIAAEC